MKDESTSNGPCDPRSEQEERLTRQVEFNLDVVLQLYQLRQGRGLSQDELAASMCTRQQVISRMESTGYSGHSLSTLRRLAARMGAYVDVVLVPEEKLQEYMEWRYQPVLMDAPSAAKGVGNIIQWKDFGTEDIAVAGGATEASPPRRKRDTPKRKTA